MTDQVLPEIPNKRYFSIGETSNLCAVKPHVLRYWEQEFSQLKPSKRSGGRRYYQYKDVLMIRQIKTLLYNQGFTISGAKQQLRSPTNTVAEPLPKKIANENQPSIAWMVTELQELLEILT